MQSPRYFRLAGRYWPLTLVLICGLVLNYFLIRTYVSPLPRQYQLDFSGAKWIEPATFSPTGYFREKIFLTVAPEQAWIQVAATDSFKLTINGKEVGLASFLKTRASGIYDIKTRLLPGTNVIGVEVDRTSFPGPAQVLVKGGAKEPGREIAPIVSDEHWKATTNTGIVQGSEAWDSPLVIDEVWPKARVSANVENPEINWVITNPLLLQLPPAGKWLLAPDTPREAIFSTSIQSTRSGEETWIQVASSGELNLLINGKLITSVPTAPLKAKPLPRLVPATIVPPKSSEQEPSSDVSTANVSSPDSLTLEAYDISQWIRRGSNRITAAVRSTQNPAAFIAEGFTVLRNGNVRRFQTDSSWQVLRGPAAAQTTESQRAIEAGGNGSAPWGYLREGFVKQPRLTDFDTVAKGCAVTIATVLAVIVAWLIASWFVSISSKRSLQACGARDALLHVPITLALSFVLLLSYDYRFPNDWPFRPSFCLGAIGALIAIRIFHVLGYYSATRLQLFPLRLRQLRLRELLPYLVLFAIMVLGLALRYHGLTFISFDHDEMGVIQKSKGVFVRGFPFNEYLGTIHPATTYELVGYVLAVFGGIFGYSEWSMRLPSCIWGTLTIGVVALMGRRLFNWRTGLIAAFIYACMTLDIRWAQNAFYVQQCQFFSMVTFWLFYEAIRVRPLQNKYFTVASIAFCLAFLSWEGSGFILPAFCVALLVVRPGDWSWLKQWHLYRCLFFVAALVIAQFCWRTILATPPYLAVGSGLSNLTGPSLFFLNYHYEPSFYVEQLLFGENHVPFTIITTLGFLLCWRQAAFRYVVTVLLTLLLLYTNFLAALSPRYCYFYQPLLLLTGIAAAVAFYDRLLAIACREGNSVVARSLAHTSGLALLVLLFVQSNEWFIKPYSFSGQGNAPGLMTRMDTYKYDYRGAAQFVKTHVQPGDVIIPIVPHVFEYYTGIQGNFFLDSLFSKKVSYNAELAEPALVDKFRGYPTIRSLTELLEATHRGRRTWIVFVPSGALKKLSSPDVLDYLEKNAKIEFESYRAKVYLIEGANSREKVVRTNSS